jgi:hypothetical protein
VLELNVGSGALEELIREGLEKAAGYTDRFGIWRRVKKYSRNVQGFLANIDTFFARFYSACDSR